MSTTEEQNSPQYFRRQLKEIEPRLSSKKLDKIMRLHNTYLSQHTQRARVESEMAVLVYRAVKHRIAMNQDVEAFIDQQEKWHLARLAQLSTKEEAK